MRAAHDRFVWLDQLGVSIERNALVAGMCGKDVAAPPSR
jgi:hypothetical protein